MSLTLSEYQDQTGVTAVYPGQGTFVGLVYAALGASNEAGEIAGKVKKMMRDDEFKITDEKRIATAGEVGDTLWYLAQVATELGLSLELIAQENLKKLADRQSRGVLQGSGDTR